MQRLAEDPKTILCISAVPPFAFAQARKIVQVLRKSLVKNPIVVGLWGGDGDNDALRERFGNARPDAIATSLSEALVRMAEIDGRSQLGTGEEEKTVASTLGWRSGLE